MALGQLLLQLLSVGIETFPLSLTLVQLQIQLLSLVPGVILEKTRKTARGSRDIAKKRECKS